MRILAVDYGDVRTGLACCDVGELLATPLKTIVAHRMADTAEKVLAVAAEQGVGEIIVGNPKNMDGSLGERAEICHSFAQLLREGTDIPVTLWDERSTTVTAIGYLNQTNTRGKKRKEVLDGVAAAIILESYLFYRKNQRG